MQISFTIPGRVGGKGRPRATVRKSGGRVFASVYTPEKTRSTEAMIRDFAQRAMGELPPFEGPCALNVITMQLVPVSWSKKRKAAAAYVTVKPDADNIIKALGDGGNGILWRDDAQIAIIQFERRYIREGQERVEISVTDLTKTDGEIAQLAGGQPRAAASLDSAARGALPLFGSAPA